MFLMGEKCSLFEKKLLATSLANYEEDSLDGNSFVSQSRFDTYADIAQATHLGHKRHRRHNRHKHIKQTYF